MVSKAPTRSIMKGSSLPPTTELFTRYRATVFRRCCELLGQEDSAKDAVQEVFLRALTTRNDFRGECSPATWLYSIATRHCLQQLRNLRRRSGKLAWLATQASLEHSTNQAEQRLTLEHILQATDETTRQLAYCRFVDGMRLEEVADVAGLSSKTVAKKLAQFSATLRQSIESSE
jgi:RNA polymerase sigma-70 factor (ECF subfamily)